MTRCPGVDDVSPRRPSRRREDLFEDLHWSTGAQGHMIYVRIRNILLYFLVRVKTRFYAIGKGVVGE